jgi:Ni/Co efflux regulator RcnB
MKSVLCALALAIKSSSKQNVTRRVNSLQTSRTQSPRLNRRFQEGIIMINMLRESSRLLTATGVVLALVAGGASAEKPDGAGGGKKKEKKEHHDHTSEKHGQGGSSSFSSEHRRIVSEYYGAEARKGKCPPGLAKKNNGCQPPGQAKKWQKGQVLASDIKYYDLPKDLYVRLPAPPPNHRYVQIAGDILMIAVGTSMVVDALEDILR